jgi:hypothetical protein
MFSLKITKTMWPKKHRSMLDWKIFENHHEICLFGSDTRPISPPKDQWAVMALRCAWLLLWPSSVVGQGEL